MKLEALGWDGEFAQQAAALCGPELSPARVTAVDRGRYLVRDEGRR